MIDVLIFFKDNLKYSLMTAILETNKATRGVYPVMGAVTALYAASSGIGSHVPPEKLTKERPTQHVSAAGTPNPP